MQTKRCRYLVAEYSRRLQEKEQLYQTEKTLRETQLTKVLKALLIFEARLRQEQKLISHQLSEKDYIIKTQKSDIKKLLANQYCKNCNQYYESPGTTLESSDSSSECVTTEQEYQSSNLESLDSNSDIYLDYPKSESETYGKLSESETYEKANNTSNFLKGKYASHPRRNAGNRKGTGMYFQVLKLRNDSPLSNEDNTSADYDNLDSLPPESVSDKISVVSENIQNMLNQSERLRSTSPESSINISSSECDKTVINTLVTKPKENTIENDLKERIIEENILSQDNNLNDGNVKEPENKLTETILIFEGAVDSNDNWYASASDQEDEEHRGVYRNNPVLECMNQILLQNISDINSPPKTPNIERKSNKCSKRVKFSDENDQKHDSHDYYETPIQRTPNYYETPQSMYSNDYEQILSKCSDTSVEFAEEKNTSAHDSHHYIEMEKSEGQENCSHDANHLVRRNKIARIPPALPPKPPNLMSKCKVHAMSKPPPSEHGSSEPDYCSISELNLPQHTVKKINVVAEVHNNPLAHDVNKPEETKQPAKEEKPNLIVRRCVEKLNIQLAKHSSIRPEGSLPKVQSPKKKNEVQIPKLPQVSEIIIPDDPDENEEENIISHDNYVKNNTQISRDSRKSIVISSSVSSLINGFNNQIINDIKKKHERIKPEPNRKTEPKNVFSSFENLQNLDKHFKQKDPQTQDFENFDLSQNFEEFKLDDCEIEEYDVEEELEREDKYFRSVDIQKNTSQIDKKSNHSRIDNIRATETMLPSKLPSTDLLATNTQTTPKSNHETVPFPEQALAKVKKFDNKPTYDHFLDCTGLSTKSIFVPTRELANQKNVMSKPRNGKLRSKINTDINNFDTRSECTKKYWSEPFV